MNNTSESYEEISLQDRSEIHLSNGLENVDI